MSSSKRARRRRRHAKYGVPVYPRRPRTGRRVDYVIIDEVPFGTKEFQAGDGAE